MPAAERRDPATLHRLAVVLAALGWSLGGVFIKELPVGPIGITFYRSGFAALSLAPLLLRGARYPPLRDIAIGSLIYAGLLSLFIASTKDTTAANAIFLQGTAPFHAIMLGPYISGETRRRGDLVAMAIAMAGIVVIVAGSYRGGEERAVLMGLGSGVMFGLMQLWLRRLRDCDPVAVTVCNNAGVALLALPVVVFFAPGEFALMGEAVAGGPAARTLGWLALMGAVQIAMPYALFSFAVRRLSTGEASLLALLEPVLNPLWVRLRIGETPSIPTLIGGALILAALALRATVLRRLS